MTRRRRTPPAPAPRIELTSMIDVTFLILIFFMCTIHFRTLEGRLESHLPRDVGEGARLQQEHERARIVVRVLEPGTRLDPAGERAWSGSGPYRHGPDRRVAYGVGPRQVERVAQVRAHLAALREVDPELEVLIDAREGTTYADVVGVIDAAREAGCESIGFAR